MPDNEEHTIGMVASNGAPYEGFVTRSGDYCFLRLNRDSHDAKFYFVCEQLGEVVYVRVLSDECLYPLVKPPSPPAEEVCYLFAKSAAENIERVVTVLGQDAESVAECYIKVVEEVTPGTIESQCTREAVKYGW